MPKTQKVLKNRFKYFRIVYIWGFHEKKCFWVMSLIPRCFDLESPLYKLSTTRHCHCSYFMMDNLYITIISLNPLGWQKTDAPFVSWLIPLLSFSQHLCSCPGSLHAFLQSDSGSWGVRGSSCWFFLVSSWSFFRVCSLILSQPPQGQYWVSKNNF